MHFQAFIISSGKHIKPILYLLCRSRVIGAEKFIPERKNIAIIAVFIIGAPVWLFMVYQTLSAVLSQFNHANIKMARWFDKSLGLIIVTPNMHRVHHHYTRPQTDSNYGNIFPFWDKLFGTYNSTPVEQITYGLDVLKDKNDESLKVQLKLPFDSSVKTDY